MSKPSDEPLNPPMSVCVLTVSDRCSRGEAEDRSGPALQEICTQHLDAIILETMILPDEENQIADQLKHWAQKGPCPDLILTTGGTGLAPRDRTPEATASVLERQHNALMELARYRCLVKTPLAYLSRGIAGTCGETMIINLPGSRKGAAETFEALLDVLPHAIETMRGEAAPDGSSCRVSPMPSSS